MSRKRSKTRAVAALQPDEPTEREWEASASLLADALTFPGPALSEAGNASSDLATGLKKTAGKP